MSHHSSRVSYAITPIAEANAASFRECLDIVAREKRFLARIEAPPIEAIREFVRESVASDAVQFVALVDDRVIGWADIFPERTQAESHCGSLGMGVQPEFRGQGIGEDLLRTCLDKALRKGITRIELKVRADNASAIRLYAKAGFVHEATMKHALRFDGVYYDALQMSRFSEAPDSRGRP